MQDWRGAKAGTVGMRPRSRRHGGEKERERRWRRDRRERVNEVTGKENLEGASVRTRGKSSIVGEERRYDTDAGGFGVLGDRTRCLVCRLGGVEVKGQSSGKAAQTVFAESTTHQEMHSNSWQSHFRPLLTRDSVAKSLFQWLGAAPTRCWLDSPELGISLAGYHGRTETQGQHGICKNFTAL